MLDFRAPFYQDPSIIEFSKTSDPPIYQEHLYVSYSRVHQDVQKIGALVFLL